MFTTIFMGNLILKTLCIVQFLYVQCYYVKFILLITIVDGAAAVSIAGGPERESGETDDASWTR